MNRRFCILFLFWIAAVSGREPQAVFLTLQHDPTSTMTINWVTTLYDRGDKIEYQAENESEWHPAKGENWLLPYRSRNLLHRVELTGLQAGQGYRFRIKGSDGAYKFKTMPSQLDDNLTFVVGGDFYHDDIKYVKETNRAAAAQNPAFAVLGGDIAYASGKLGWSSDKMHKWMEWLEAWTKSMITPDGYQIPMIAIIGNHDVNGGYNKSPAHALTFYQLFVPRDQRAYRTWDFGDYLTIVGLDSGHTNPIAGEQTSWLDRALADREAVSHKFAVYHVPAYPSFRSLSDKHCNGVRQFWTPVFEKYGLHAAFENHDHAYKRTHHILQSKVHPDGVLYIGDGGWGVKKPRTTRSPTTTWYLAKCESARNFVCVTIDKEKRAFNAYDSDGKLIDHFEEHLQAETVPASP